MTVREFYKMMEEAGLLDYEIRVYDNTGETTWMDEYLVKDEKKEVHLY